MTRSPHWRWRCCSALARPASAEVDEIKIGKQYGLPYIQFVIMEDQKLIEKHGKLQGSRRHQGELGDARRAGAAQ
jgi:hypothetical protein